jgi:hypothetical protein
MSWNLKFFFQSCDWTLNLKLFYEGLVAESFKSEPKAWLSWAEILIYFFQSLWLNFKPQAVLWRSRSQELEMWPQGLAQMSWNLKFFFQSCDWTSNLKLFYEGPIAESLKSDPKA